MKKLFTILILSLICALCTIGFVACDTSADNRDAQIVSVYNTYVAYAEENGETPLSYEEWLKSIKGKDGKDGTGIKSAVINENGELVLTLTDNTVINAGKIGVKIESSNEPNESLFIFTLLDNETYEIKAKNTENIQNKLILPSTYNGKPVTSIGTGAFNNCKRLTKIVIPDTINEIKYYAFTNCASLTNIYYTGTVSEWASKINGLNNIMYSGRNLFVNNKLLTEVNLEGITEIKPYAFCHCSSLTEVMIPDTVISIGYGAFGACTSLTNITIPHSVEHIESAAFAQCYKLIEVYNKSSLNIFAGSEDNGRVGYYAKNVYTSEYTSKLSNQNGYILYDNTVLLGYNGTDTDLVINSGIKEIHQYAFRDCSTLTSITLPDSVQEIGEQAFVGCIKLTKINIPSGITDIKKGTFANCINLSNIIMPESVISIDYGAFYGCGSLTEIIIPSNTTSIGQKAFYGCDDLKSVIFINAEGWYIDTYETEILLNNDLTNKFNAALYLMSNYVDYQWNCRH